jgi:hypothetical protein
VDDFPRPAIATRKTYRYALVHFIERFDGVRLIAFDRSTGYQWAQTQPHGTTAVCRTMFADAINAGLYRGPNPFANLRRPKSRGRRDIEVMKQDELARLVDCAESCWGEYGRLVLGPLIEFQAYVTTRPAELYFIERSDVQGDLVYVLDSDDSTGEPKLPKNDQKRKVVLPPPAAVAIARVPSAYSATSRNWTGSTESRCVHGLSTSRSTCARRSRRCSPTRDATRPTPFRTR